jgi:excisionase family DNA binding protein
MLTPAVHAEVRFMGYRAAAAYCGMSSMTLRRLVQSGRLKTYRPTGDEGRIALFDKGELDRFILASGASAAEEEE